MKLRVKARQKFEKKTLISKPVTPSVTPTSNEQRNVEPNDRSANIYKNTSATRLLDEVVVRHLGIHKARAIVMLRRLSESNFNNGAAIVSRSPAQKVPKLCTQLNKSTYFLRSRSGSKAVNTNKVIEKTTPRKQERPRKSNCSPKPTRQRSPVYETSSVDDRPLSPYINTKQKTKDNIRRSKRLMAKTTTTANNTKAEEPDFNVKDSFPRLVFIDDYGNLDDCPIRNTPMSIIENNEEEIVGVHATCTTGTIVPIEGSNERSFKVTVLKEENDEEYVNDSFELRFPY